MSSSTSAAFPRGTGVNRVTCNAPDCRWWAVTYTTLADNPKPWPEAEYFMGGTHPVTPFWYACQKHTTHKHKLLTKGEKPVCERCGRTDSIQWTGGGTAYHFKPTVWDLAFYGEDGPPDPNRACPYCPDCADEYHEYWNGMWEDYRSMVGV
jgi:hypothetical protein